ncbi:hypothetical protein TNCV_1247951 [Trichonephila clavipes]|nr:hypothetical protein TNCV_1247951 [Trichonephila clavipes]
MSVSKRRRNLTQEEILRSMMNKSNEIIIRSELSNISDDDNAANKTYESRILEGESSSDESDEEKHGDI